MPATSKSQQRLFGMVHAYQKGKLKDAPESVKRIAGSISKSDAKHFAQTKHDGLPERKKEEKAAELLKSAWRAAEAFREKDGPYGYFGPGGIAERHSVDIDGDGNVSSSLASTSTLVERQEKKAMELTPYQMGFMAKCAERGLDERSALALLEKDADSSWMPSLGGTVRFVGRHLGIPLLSPALGASSVIKPGLRLGRSLMGGPKAAPPAAAASAAPTPTPTAPANPGTGNWWDSTKALAKDFYGNNKDWLKPLGISMAVGGVTNAVRNWMRPEKERTSTLGALARGGLYGGLVYGGVRGGQYVDNRYNKGAVGNWAGNKWNQFENWYNGLR